MNTILKETLRAKYKNCLLHIKIGEEIKRYSYNPFKKTQRKRQYLIRRGEKAKMKLTQFESIPFLSREE